MEWKFHDLFANSLRFRKYTSLILISRGPQYWDEEKWDQDQLWRFTLAMTRWIDMCEQSLTQASVASWEVNNKSKNLAEQNGLCRRIGSLARRQVSNVFKVQRTDLTCHVIGITLL